jgi:hypothetical protein
VISIAGCKICQVSLPGHPEVCPLCGRQIQYAKDAPSVSRLYPVYQKERGLGNHWQFFVRRVLPVLLIAFFLAPTLLTLITGKGDVWLDGETLATGFAWVLIRYTWMSRLHLGKKFLIQLANVSLLLYLVDNLTGCQGWALDYAIPLLLTLSSLSLLTLVYRRRRLWSDYAGYVLALLFLGFLPWGLYLLSFSSRLWPSLLSAAANLAAFVAVYFFLDKGFRSHFNRRLHF